MCEQGWKRSCNADDTASGAAAVMESSILSAAQMSIPPIEMVSKIKSSWLNGQIRSMQKRIRVLENRMSSTLIPFHRNKIKAERDLTRREYNKLKGQRKSLVYSEHITCKSSDDIWRLSRMIEYERKNPPCTVTDEKGLRTQGPGETAETLLHSFFPDGIISTIES